MKQANFLTMPAHLTQQEIQHRNQLIVDLLSSANGEEVHINDIAWFLQLDPNQVDCWMRQHGLGKWMTGKKRFYWRGICKKRVLQEHLKLPGEVKVAQVIIA